MEGGREGGRLKKVLHPLITEEVVLCYTNIEIDSQVNFRSDVLVSDSITRGMSVRMSLRLCFTNIEIDSQVNFRSDVLVSDSITRVCPYVCPYVP